MTNLGVSLEKEDSVMIKEDNEALLQDYLTRVYGGPGIWSPYMLTFSGFSIIYNCEKNVGGFQKKIIFDKDINIDERQKLINLATLNITRIKTGN